MFFLYKKKKWSFLSWLSEKVVGSASFVVPRTSDVMRGVKVRGRRGAGLLVSPGPGSIFPRTVLWLRMKLFWPMLRAGSTGRVITVYEVDRWVEARHVQTTGTDTSPEWAVPVLSANERKGRETATYSVTFLLGDKTFTEPVKEAEWSRIRKSGSIVVKQNFWGAIRSVASR